MAWIDVATQLWSSARCSVFSILSASIVDKEETRPPMSDS